VTINLGGGSSSSLRFDLPPGTPPSAFNLLRNSVALKSYMSRLVYDALMSALSSTQYTMPMTPLVFRIYQRCRTHGPGYECGFVSYRERQRVPVDRQVIGV